NYGTNEIFLPAGPGRISDVSAGLGGGGVAEVYVLAADHSVWVYNTDAWRSLGGWASEISATRDGHVYAIGSDGKGYLNNDNGNAYTWQWLGAPTVSFVYGDGLRVTQSWASEISAGAGQVFAIGPDHAIYVDNGATPGSWQLVDNARYFSKASATQDGQVY